ncbi:MAG: hypothetical protein ACRD2A_05365 [Vicinamibacterales bacterium]
MSTIRRRLRPAAVVAAAIALILPTQAQTRQAGTGAAGHASSRANKAERTISSKQFERLEARIATAHAIVRRFESEANARGLASGWRQATLDTLLPLSLERLRQVEQQAISLDGVLALAHNTVDDPTALGNPDRDLVYTPISPCRFIDTRNIGGKINGVRAFDADQAGSAFGGAALCHLAQLFLSNGADEIAALAMNVTIVDTSAAGAPGFLAVKPAAVAPVSSLLNWYEQGANVQVANQGIVSLRQDNSTQNEFVIETSGAVHVVVDVFGGFLAPVATELQTEQIFQLVVVANGAIGEVESPVCTPGYKLTGGGCFTDQNHHYVTLSYPGGGDARWACRSLNASGGASALFARAICARVPGR